MYIKSIYFIYTKKGVMIAKVYSITVNGLESSLIEIEVDINQ